MAKLHVNLSTGVLIKHLSTGEPQGSKEHVRYVVVPCGLMEQPGPGKNFKVVSYSLLPRVSMENMKRTFLADAFLQVKLKHFCSTHSIRSSNI